MQLFVGDVCSMKKQHPCGDNRFEVLRIGADFRVRCLGCGRELWMTRAAFEKGVKSVARTETPPENAPGNT